MAHPQELAPPASSGQFNRRPATLDRGIAELIADRDQRAPGRSGSSRAIEPSVNALFRKATRTFAAPRGLLDMPRLQRYWRMDLLQLAPIARSHR